MPRERQGIPGSFPATGETRATVARPLGQDSPEELRKRAARARRAEIALVWSYLRALRRVGEVPLTAARPEMPR